MTTANKITIARILMIPVFVMMAIYYGQGRARGEPQEWQRWATVAVFLIAAASDGIDGYIARRYNQKSQLGVVLDPLADKGLLLAAIITLSFSNWTYEFPIWFPVLVITRDAVILTGTLVLHFLVGKVQVKPSWMGKAATAFQMLAIAWVLLQIKYHLVPVTLAGIFTLVSGIGYVMDGIRQLQAGGHANAKV
jgi:CDP-diacylglycerol--glycerol-3-phosphate 3-phosphatidyltransferase